MNRRTLVGRFLSGTLFGTIVFFALRLGFESEGDLPVALAYGAGLLFAIIGWPAVRYVLSMFDLFDWFQD